VPQCDECAPEREREHTETLQNRHSDPQRCKMLAAVVQDAGRGVRGAIRGSASPGRYARRWMMSTRGRGLCKLAA
jgi:hypothetical protein